MAQTSDITTPQSFPYFSDPRFPTEIKDLIWEFAIEAIPPRTVDIIYNFKLPCISWLSTSPIPALLHTCSRSRFLAQKHYQLSFPSNFDRKIPTIFFNFEKDTLYLGKPFGSTVDFMRDIGWEERRKVKHLALGLAQQTKDEEFLAPREEYESVDVADRLFEAWPGLKSVGFVDQETGYLDEIEDEDEAWGPQEYVILVDREYTRGGMLEEVLLGDFEERCEELGREVPEMRFLEVRKVVKKQVS